jgi:hypothetical protein
MSKLHQESICVIAKNNLRHCEEHSDEARHVMRNKEIDGNDVALPYGTLSHAASFKCNVK